MGTTHRGIALLTALFIALVVGIIARAVIAFGPGALAASRNLTHHQAASQAAEAGLEYALARLQENPLWRGEGTGVVVDRPDCTVVEENGNVVGILRAPDGSVRMFRIRFNYQDGPQNVDSLDDPSPQMAIDSVYVSVNNFDSAAQTWVPRADQGTWMVSVPDQGDLLPGAAACVLSEGLAGPGLRDVTAADPRVPRGNGVVASRVAEAYFQAKLGEQVVDAAVMGGGDVTFDVGSGEEVKMIVESGRDTPRLRSKALVAVAGGDPSENLSSVEQYTVSDGGDPPTYSTAERPVPGEVSRDQAVGFSAAASSSITLVQEDPSDGKDFYNLRWDDVKKADSTPGSLQAVQIPAGTYVHWDDGSLHYYDMSWADYKTFMSDPANVNDPGVSITSNDLSEVRDPANMSVRGLNVKRGSPDTKWDIKKDLAVMPTAAGTKDFSVVIRAGARLDPADVDHLVPNAPADTLTLDNLKIKLNDATISVPGNMLLTAKVNGRDSTITTEGSLTSISESIWMIGDDDGKVPEDGGDGDGDDEGGRDGNKKGGGKDGVKPVQVKMGLNLYSKGDIKLSTFDGTKFGKIGFRGVVYTWKNFYGLARDPSIAESGEFRLEGTLVAYGSDPLSGRPGATGEGDVHIAAESVELLWNKQSLATLLAIGQMRSLKMERTFYGRY
ncbi:MAG: hypothetical protein AB1758_27170 [Candidatus Eremiobacterota bacterium]